MNINSRKLGPIHFSPNNYKFRRDYILLLRLMIQSEFKNIRGIFHNNEFSSYQ